MPVGDKLGKTVLLKTVGGRELAWRPVNQRRPVQLECRQTEQKSAPKVFGACPGRTETTWLENTVGGGHRLH